MNKRTYRVLGLVSAVVIHQILKKSPNQALAQSEDRTISAKATAWIFGITFLFYVILFAWGPLLWILGFILLLIPPLIGVFFIIRAHYSIDHEKQHIYDEIEGLANDASFDLSEQLIVWDKLRLTKGIGPPLEGHDEKIAEIHHRLVAARDEITAAESPQHQLEAVLAADSVIATAKSLL